MRAILRWLIRVAVVAALFVAVGLISARLRRPGPEEGCSEINHA